MARKYGAINEGSVSRTETKGFRTALVALALTVVVVCLVSQRYIAGTTDLIDKQQASWGVLPSEDWDQGWLHKFVASGGNIDDAQILSSTKSLNAEVHTPSIEEVDNLMKEAVGMLKELKAEQEVKNAKTVTVTHAKLADAVPVVVDPAAPVAPAAPATAPAAPAPAAYVPNKYDLDRDAKYAAQQGINKDLPQCFKINKFDDIAKNEAKRRMSEATAQLGKAYPDWAKGLSIPGVGQTGEWRHDRGPPYVRRLTMFAGDGVDTIGNGNLVRRVLGLKTAFGKPCDLRSCQHAWSTNEYIRSFEGSQFRFLYRNQCSSLVIPPLTHGAGPILDNNGLYRLHHFLKDGYNTLIVLGSVASVLFLNQNVATIEGGFSFTPDWVSGPYEAQAAQKANTPFAALSVTLPGPGTSVVGVKKATLPTNAISYYEAEDVSVVFEIPMGTGRILYLGYDYSEPVVPWVHALVAATMFSDYDTKAPPPPHLAASLGRK
mmetsp:Transcript_913/g.2283  ORF Transcript_913/g.2283 Transcript_913/m.2283 type:complete len:489 (-) Transcript_913:100-1566(-)